MNAFQLKLFGALWDSVPTTWLDTETTGIRPGADRAVQVGLARFEDGACVASLASEINPGMPIPPEATAIHGITDEMVRCAPTIDEFFSDSRATELLDGAQPGAYNASFDRAILPANVLPQLDHDWPWLDAMSMVRAVDRWEPGKWRHRLAVSAARHGVALPQAHSAGADARASGELFYLIVPKLAGCDEARRLPPASRMTLGHLLCWQKIAESREWYRFHSWLAAQPPLEEPPKGAP